MIVKVKRKFSERWARQFVKQFNGIKCVLSGYFVSTTALEDFMLETYDYVFAIAKAARVKPAAVAKILMNKSEAAEWSAKIVEELAKLTVKAEKKANNPATKPKKAKKKVAKKKK